MKTLTAFCFSGTGNTRYIANYLLEHLSAGFETELFDLPLKEPIEEKIARADVLLFAFPIYGSSPPIPMRNFVQRYGALFKGKEAVVVETQYFYSGDGAASLGRALKKRGCVLIGAEMFNMPNNLADCRIFKVKNGEDVQKVLSRARKKADRFAARLLKGNARLRGFSPLSHAVGYFTQRKFWREGEAEKRSRLRIDPSRCIGCGKCVKDCPADNLLLQGGLAKPLGKCALCYRCVNCCPKKAIALIGSAPPETQYRGPV